MLISLQAMSIGDAYPWNTAAITMLVVSTVAFYTVFFRTCALLARRISLGYIETVALLFAGPIGAVVLLGAFGIGLGMLLVVLLPVFFSTWLGILWWHWVGAE